MLREAYEIIRDASMIFVFSMTVLACALVACGYREGILQ